MTIEPPLGRIDRYVLGLMWRPVLACLVVTLIALLLERVLRLVSMLEQSGASAGMVVELAANLIPHYLGLALPMAFFVALFIVIARLGDNSEIDALMAAGMSLTRLAAPLIGLGLALALFGLLLFGELQPYSRYAYRAVMNAAVNAGWNARLQDQVVVDAGHGLVITADHVDVSGRKVQGVFVRRTSPDGEEIITATSGELNLSGDKKTLDLHLDAGQEYKERPGKAAQVLGFQNILISEPLDQVIPRIHSRGDDERELTLLELIRQIRSPHPIVTRRTLEAELYARLARALSPAFLPLLALPLGLSSKRGRRTPGLILAGLLLFGFNHAIQLGQSLAESGKAPAAVAVLTPFALFAILSAWLFLASRERPGQTPLSGLFGLLDQATDAVAARLPKFRRRRAAAA